MAPLTTDDYLRILDPAAPRRLGHIRHALFDFDGTISVLRQGWEEVMIPLMVEMICDDRPPTPAIEREVAEYVDVSTGIVTIEQMRWLAEAVRRHGLANHPLSAAQYKAIYIQRLAVRVEERLDHLARGEVAPDDMMLAGARAFVAGLAARGVHLYLASGTDHEFAVNESRALGIDTYFTGGVYGALDDDESHRKERIIQRILDEHELRGDELLVVGDGPVELREAVSRQALALGVASDEVARSGWNPAKIARLTRAGAHFLVPDLSRAGELLSFLTPTSGPTHSTRTRHGRLPHRH
jgi:phosphoglycolate phosphatase-like HAD superfamily hydrolase